ncbi:MAG: kelch repeat-containing protein [Nitrososphaerales archaeon]
MIAVLIFSFTPTIEGRNEWSTGSDMPTPRTEITASAVGSRIYVVGGFNADGGTTSVIEVYDPRSNTWSDGKKLPIALHHAASESYQGKLYVIGGYSEGWIPSNSLFIYDLLTDEWTAAKDMPTPRGALTTQFINGMLYAVGGWNGMPLSVNEAYDPATNSWITKASMPTAREHLASGVIDGKLYVIGGRQGSLLTNLSVNEEYDPEKDEWTTKAPMPSSRGGIVAASLSESIYVFGGETRTITFYNNEQYIASLDKWIVRERMPTARHGLAAAEAGGSIYVIGGGIDPGLSVSNKNEVFTPADLKAIKVFANPMVTIEPEDPKTDDKIKVNVSFETNTAGFSVKFNELTRAGNTITSDVTVIPPSPDMIVAQVITRHSHVYMLEQLSAGDYVFSVSINDQKSVASAKFTVTSKTLFIDVLEPGLKEFNMGDVIVFQRNIMNTADTAQSFVNILQVKDESGIVVSLTWSEGELVANESRLVLHKWLPSGVGIYLLQFFVWDSMENPEILDSLREVSVNVS